MPTSTVSSGCASQQLQPPVFAGTRQSAHPAPFDALNTCMLTRHGAGAGPCHALHALTVVQGCCKGAVLAGHGTGQLLALIGRALGVEGWSWGG